MSITKTSDDVRNGLELLRRDGAAHLSAEEKVLIAAEWLKRQPRAKNKPPRMNDADIVYALVELFPNFKGADRDLYQLGRVFRAIPVVRPNLVRSMTCGRHATLKQYIKYDPRDGAYAVHMAGSARVLRLLFKTRQPAKQKQETTSQPAPFANFNEALYVGLSSEELRSLRASLWRSVILVDSLRRLSCVKRPHAPSVDDWRRVEAEINDIRVTGDTREAMVVVREAVEQVANLDLAEASLARASDTVRAAIMSGAHTLLACVEAALKSPSRTPLDQPYHRTHHN